MAVKRIRKEWMDIQTSNIDWLVVNYAEDIFVWTGLMMAPNNGCYDGATFAFRIEFPPDYPFKKFKFNFTTQIKSISLKNGIPCCAFRPLCDEWSPRYTVQTVTALLRDFIGSYQEGCDYKEVSDRKANPTAYDEEARRMAKEGTCRKAIKLYQYKILRFYYEIEMKILEELEEFVAGKKLEGGFVRFPRSVPSEWCVHLIVLIEYWKEMMCFVELQLGLPKDVYQRIWGFLVMDVQHLIDAFDIGDCPLPLADH